MKAPLGISMSSDFPHYSFRMPNIGFQNLPLNIYIVVFGTAIFVFILSLLFCCYLISEKQQVSTKFTPRHPAISYVAGQMIPLTLLREVKVTCNGGFDMLRHQAHKELYAYKQVIQKEKVKELNLHEICAVCLEEFKQKDELGICPCKHAFHRKCLIKWLEVRKVCPLCNMPVLQLAQQAGSTEPPVPIQQPLPGIENLV
ncbi:RING finger protein 24 [Dissostichus eleginoides]|nr:RING finger protein 24 [Dissostichus eleginoides]